MRLMGERLGPGITAAEMIIPVGIRKDLITHGGFRICFAIIAI